jgi:hypothetical protein
MMSFAVKPLACCVRIQARKAGVISLKGLMA